MGERELQEALRGKAQAQIRQIWQTAEAAVATRRAETGAEQAAQAATAERELATAAAVTRRNVLAVAALEAERQCLTAENLLRDRLRALADHLLAGLDRKERQRLWPVLAAELPAAAWQTIRVHPDDLPAARQCFPAAAVTADPALAGGLVATAEEGRIVVDNSLNGRLERVWPELLAPLFAAVNAEVENDAAGPAASD